LVIPVISARPQQDNVTGNGFDDDFTDEANGAGARGWDLDGNGLARRSP